MVLPKVLYRATSYDYSMRLVNSLAVSATITSLKIPKNIPGIISFANFGVYIGYLKSTKNKLRPHGLGTFYPGIKFLFDTDNFMNLSSENIEITNHIGELMDPRYIDVIDASGNLVEDFNEMPFEKIEGVNLISEPDECRSNFWLQTLLIDLNNAGHRDEILRVTNKLDFMTRPAWSLINEMEPFRKFPSMNLDIAKSLVLRLINIPSSPGLVLAKS